VQTRLGEEIECMGEIGDDGSNNVDWDRAAAGSAAMTTRAICRDAVFWTLVETGV
jgi:hypothetical protein